MPQAKRILKIEVKLVEDPYADTSYLGTYSNHAANEYAIDRAHEEDCILNLDDSQKVRERLDRASFYLRQTWTDSGNKLEDAAYDDAVCILSDAQEELGECDCGGENNWNRREYRYFNTSGNYAGESPEDIHKYTRQDYERMESLNNGNWSYIGIHAQAKIVIGDVCQTITSGGLWGIESDSDPAYLKEIEDEELSSLRDILHNLGFSKRAIATAVKDLQHS